MSAGADLDLCRPMSTPNKSVKTQPISKPLVPAWSSWRADSKYIHNLCKLPQIHLKIQQIPTKAHKMAFECFDDVTAASEAKYPDVRADSCWILNK